MENIVKLFHTYSHFWFTIYIKKDYKPDDPITSCHVYMTRLHLSQRLHLEFVESIYATPEFDSILEFTACCSQQMGKD